MNADDFVHHIVQAADLLKTQHRQPLLRIRTIGSIAVIVIIVIVVVIIVIVGIVIIVRVVIVGLVIKISIADAVGLTAVHLAERLHHSDPTLAFLADLQRATLQQIQKTKLLRDSLASDTELRKRIL